MGLHKTRTTPDDVERRQF